ncbi:hypothetical protein BGZ63DRAFT_427395 [Mariannaea sp. PMI_226]|nr:hypothetical protein BGZ63DRAFT_427395 [Mariannaea sp. PMI_226]
MARIYRAADSHTATSIPSIDQHSPSTNVSAASAETTTIDVLEGMLKELTISQVQNSSLPQKYDQFDFSSKYHAAEPRVIKYPSRGPRHRAPIDTYVFEPLDAVQEESYCAPTEPDLTSATSSTYPVASTAPAASQPSTAEHQSSEALNLSVIHHPLQDAHPKHPRRDHIERHLAGQFEWLLSCSAPAGSPKGHHTSPDGDSRLIGNLVFGSTPLEGNASSLSESDLPKSLGDQANMAMSQPPPYEYYQTTPLKVPEVEVAEVVEQAVSPSLTLISDRSSSYAGGSSRAGSFSVPRIEDSLEELDKLEDELEAINAFAQQGQVTSRPALKSSRKSLEPPSQATRSTVSKRASMSGLASTVRIKQTDKTQPQVRRATSLVFRNKPEGSQASPKHRSQLSQGQIASIKTAKPPVKSRKAPTIPNFELPGEAVARRLKEQREARLAQQAETQKVYVPPARNKSSKPLTKPTFELPGEAISRRKREEREARLKAQEEEERKRREFKARPVRISSTPSTMPRETIASRARQGNAHHVDDAEKRRQEARLKRASVPLLRSSHGEQVEGKATQSRGRLSTMVSDENLKRETSPSAGSSNSKRNTLTAEDAQQLRRKGKQIFERDNTSFRDDKERERKEREAAARAAREEAAERSRAASREWADKRRRKEMAALQATKRVA